MKKIIISSLIRFTYSFLILFTFAQINYLNALKVASQTEGSDAAIQAAMFAHGFRTDIFEEVTTVEKFQAIGRKLADNSAIVKYLARK